MEKISVKVVSVKVYDDKDIPSVTLSLNKAIKGFAFERDDKGQVKDDACKEVDVTDISIQRSKLTRQLCEVNELIDLYRGCRVAALGQKQFNLILKNATLSIVRTRHAEGEEQKDNDGNPVLDKDGNVKTYGRDCYTTDVVGVTLSDAAVGLLNAFCTLD